MPPALLLLSWPITAALLLLLLPICSFAIIMSTSPPIARRRMLFLHGQFLLPECYTDKLATQFLETIKTNGYECVFVTSPRDCPDPVPEIVSQTFPLQKRHPEWINSQKKQEADNGSSKIYNGLTDSLEFLQEYLKEQPPFHVIAGHSNGALMASILSLKMETDPDFLPPDKKCQAILLLNGPASYETEAQLQDVVKSHGPVMMPSVHVWGGPTDLTWQGEQELYKIHHPSGVVIQHEAGHFFPSEQTYYDQIVQELDKVLSK